jgi:phosphocarrier protein FPr/phosphocarrier protein
MSHSLDLLAPFDGIAMALAAVSDPVFAGLMLGDGLAIEPLSSTLLAPCDGVITQLSRTGHALTLTASNGAELLIHIGIDTVRLGGEGFTALVKQGDKVSGGQALIDVDIDRVARRSPSLQTMLVLVNQGFEISARGRGMFKAGDAGFMTLVVRAAAEAAPMIDGQALRAMALVSHESGLHARPSAQVQAVAKSFSAEITVEFKGRSANARSVTALMGLGVVEGGEVSVSAKGSDASEALLAVVQALQIKVSASPPVIHAAIARSVPAVRASGLYGICAAPGLALGSVVRLDQRAAVVPEQGEGVTVELARLTAALTQGALEIHAAISAAAIRQASVEEDIFTAHLALAEDPELIDAARAGIEKGLGAGFAYRQAVGAQVAVLLGLDNQLLSERVSDLRDVERLMLAAMGYAGADKPELGLGSILVADELSASDLAGLPRDRLAGFATVNGGATSHVAILARALGVPALVAVGPELLKLQTGHSVLLDASRGFIETAVSLTQMADAGVQIAAGAAMREMMLADADQAALTLDGVRIEVAANIANLDDAREALGMGADGIGLLRTEFLFMGRSTMPDASEQQSAYQDIVDAMQGRTVIIRTLDAGGDKALPYLTWPAEDNPALGLRGIRSGFAQPDLLDAQLRGLLAVKPLSNLRILIPMIADVSEVLRVRERIAAIAQAMQIAVPPQLGVMIEVPSAALLADQLAAHVDFFSIGSNDLTQYTLAMDRCHAGLAGRIDAMHPALLRLIEMTVQGAKRHGKWVGLCGGMASELEAVPVLLGLGVTELSVSPLLVPEVKALVRSLSQAQCRMAAQALLQLESAEAVRAAARRQWPQLSQASQPKEIR